MEQYPFNDDYYLRFCELIQARTGIRVAESRREVLARALLDNARSVECSNLDQLFLCLQDARTDSEVWNDLIKKVTIGETYFFRDSDHIQSLRNYILPALIARHRTDHTLRLWSAGCATGEEPYTLAILLRQILFDIDQWNILILATDINRQALLHATAGRYRAWSFRETDPALRSAFFIRDGDTFILESDVREMVTFTYHNLAEGSYPSPANQTCDLDLILCRNVAIYLPKSVIQDIANRFYECLSDGGWLIVGPSETNVEIYQKFRVVNYPGTIAYQKAHPTPASSGLRDSESEKVRFGRTDTRPESLPVESAGRDQGMRVSGMNHDSCPVSELSFFSHPADVSPGCSTDGIQRVTPSEPVPRSEAIPQTVEYADLCQQGKTFMKQQRHEEARECFLACLANDPGCFPALYGMACLEANAGRLDEARKWAERALDHDPLRSEVHYTLALIHEVQGKLKEAVNRLKKVIYLDPNFILAHFGLFHLYQRTGHPKEAERHRILAVHLASKTSPEAVLPGSEDLTAGQLLTMAKLSLTTHRSC